MLRTLLLCIPLTSILCSFNASAQSDPHWETVKYRSQAWVWGWTIVDISSLSNNMKVAEESKSDGRRARAEAESVRAALALWGVWKNQPAYFSLTNSPTEEQKQAQIRKANEFYNWKSRIPNLVVHLALTGWVLDKGDEEQAGILMASGIFWGEVSLLTQRILDTDWHFRIQDDQLHVSLPF